MNLNRRHGARLHILICLAATLTAGASYWYYAACARRLDGGLESLRSCAHLAAQIQQTQAAPQRARLETWSQDDLGSLVERAASGSQISRDKVLRIDPQPPKRLGKSDYVQQATEVELIGVQLPQIIGFAYGVTAGDDQLQIGTLRLRTPHQADTSRQELWLAEVVLTQRIFAPTTQDR